MAPLDTSTKINDILNKSTLGGLKRRNTFRKPSETVTSKAANILVKGKLHMRSSSMSPDEQINVLTMNAVNNAA